MNKVVNMERIGNLYTLFDDGKIIQGKTTTKIAHGSLQKLTTRGFE